MAVGWLTGSAAHREERAQREAEQATVRLAAIVGSCPDAIIGLTVDGTIESWNAGAERLYGYAAGEAVGRPITILNPPEHADHLEHVTSALAGRAVKFETQDRRQDGSLVEVGVTISPVCDRSGAVIGVSCLAQDMTERKQTERELARLADAAQYATDAVLSIDLQGRVRHWNRGAERVYGFTAAEAVGRDLRELTMLADEPSENIARVLAGETGYQYEARRRCKDGTILDALTTITPWRVDGRVVGVTGVTVEITERKRAERAAARLAAIVQSSDDAIVGKMLDGQITSWNAAAERIYGYSAAEAVGANVSMLLAPGGEDELAGVLARVAAGDRVSHLQTVRRRKDGELIDVSVTVSPILDSEHRVVGASTIARDITEQRHAERELERLAQAAAYGSDAVISVDLTGRVQRWNPGAGRLLGFTADEVIGRDIEQLGLAPDGYGDSTPARDALAEVLAGGPTYQYEAQRPRKDGALIDALVTLVPWHADGRIVGVTASCVDLTERRRIERARERALADLNEAQRTARIGSWSWDPTADQASWSPQMFAIFARDPAQGPATSQALFEYIHPDDRERLAEGYAQAFGGGPGFELDYRILARDGTCRWLHGLGHADRARPGCYLGTVQDVTEARAAEVALHDAQERFRRMFEEAPIGMAVLSPDGEVEHANPAMGVICGRLCHELEGVGVRELLHPADADSISQQLGALAGSDSDQLAVEARMIPPAGSPVEISIHATVLRDHAGGRDRLLCQFQDITERKRFETQLQFMADHDPLTGLLNRCKFEVELDRHVERVKRYGSEGALLMLDIDHFKQVNDTLGHNAGDELIVSIAGVLGDRVRASDVLARLGGDEFAVLLPKADVIEAIQVAQALVDAVRTNTVLLGGQRAKVTTSIGVTMFDAASDGLSGETVLIEGDLAMYDAKEAGRDGYAVYASSEHRASRTQARLTWVARIEHALEHDRFALVAQPILDLHTGRVGQHELLLRMLDDHDDMIPPAAFLYIAERFGLIARLDEWVVTHAIGLIAQHPQLCLHVNISGRSLGDPKLLHAIDERLQVSRVDPTRLIFEVTETAAVANITHAQAFAQRLRDHGCRFALDDFGAGFGSFYYLKHLPFDYVKIDGEFIAHATSGHIDRLVIEAVVRIAQGLGKETIAEFVTDENTRRMVTRLGVDHAQGYHTGKPIPVADLIATTPPGPPTADALADVESELRRLSAPRRDRD
ncbi:MAG: PAS domain S-box protein [Solirubrobacteraceae bacterium]|jgi:diguanylate cyclase (GGDEF)-like protein/PAS domain S-box-containing protein